MAANDAWIDEQDTVLAAFDAAQTSASSEFTSDVNPAYQVYLGYVATADLVYNAAIANPNDTAALAAAVSAWNASETAAWSAFLPIQNAALASYHCCCHFLNRELPHSEPRFSSELGSRCD